MVFVFFSILNYDNYNHTKGFVRERGTDQVPFTVGFKDGTNTGDDYSYDVNGNMTRDNNKGIDNILYNHLNLPVEIIFGTGNKIEYLYNAVGQKVRKTVTKDAVATVTDYLDGFQYTDAKLNFFPHAEGYVKVTLCEECEQQYQVRFNYVYNYLDHLGNIRLSYGIDPKDDVLKIMEENHYYPFGLKHTNYNVDKLILVKDEEEAKYSKLKQLPSGEQVEYKYKFNNREWQDELGLNVTAMDYRQYDNALGRFNSIDALSERAYDISPYRFALNNPNIWMDPTGLFETRKEAREYRKEHGISGRISKQSDGTFAINDKKHGISYSKGDDSNFGMDAHANDGVIESVLVEATTKKGESNFVSNGKTINDYAGLGLAPVEYIPGSFRLGTANQAFSPKYYANWTTGNQYTKVTTLSKVGKGLGWAGLGVGTYLDYQGVKNYNNPKIGPNSPNSVNPGKAGLNLGMGLYGIFINPIPSLMYSGIDTFYPGGWDQAMKDQDRLNRENKAINPDFQLFPGAMKF